MFAPPLRCRLCPGPQCDPMGNPVQPGRKAGPLLVSSQRGPNLEKGLLRQISCIVVVAAQPPEVSEYPLVKQADQFGCRGDVSRFSPLTQSFRVIAHILLSD